MAEFDTILRGGTIVDGSGKPAFTGDLAIRDGVIAAIGKDLGRAAQTVNADGLLITPGWVDIHTHYDGQVTWDAFLRVLRAQGVEDSVRPLRMTSVEAAQQLRAQGRRLAFLYVDGRHDEAAVAEDLNAYLPLLAPTAWVAMDDARPEGSFPGVYRSFERILAPLATEPRWGAQGLLVRLRPQAGSGEDAPAGLP